MPIRQEKGKWYWGSKGPFDSKKKAQEVAQAAHASGYKKASDRSASGGNREMGYSAPLTAMELNRKKGLVIQKQPQRFGNPQGDALKRGAIKPSGWERGESEKKSAAEKLKEFINVEKLDQQRSTNHPSVPSNYQGKMGAKRIDWRKKKNPDFEKLVRGGSPTDSVYQSSMDTSVVKAIWLQKFMDVSRQRVIAYILKEANGEESEETESSESEESVPTEDELPPSTDVPVGALQWDPKTMGRMPQDLTEISDVSEAPKGTRIIEGPQGGLYYQGDPEQGLNREHQAYGDTFNRLRRQLIPLHKELAKLTAERIRTVANFENHKIDNFPAKGIMVAADIEKYWENLQTKDETDEIYQRLRYDATRAEIKEKEQLNVMEPKHIEAVNALLKIFGHIPHLDGVKLEIDPNITLRVDDDGSYIKQFIADIKDGVLKEFLWNRGLDWDNPDAYHSLSNDDKDKLHKLQADYIRLDFDQKRLGGSYYKQTNDTTINPHVVSALFGDDLKDYMSAIQTITHEVIHSANKDKDTQGIMNNLRRSLKGMSFEHGNTLYGNVIGNDAFITHPRYSRRNQGALWDGGDHFQKFLNETGTELISQLVLNQRYVDPKKPKRSAATPAEAAQMSLPGGDDASGYHSMMPIYARWLLLKHDNDPAKARKYAVQLFHGENEDDESLQYEHRGRNRQTVEDFLHFHAVGSLTAEGGRSKSTNQLNKVGNYWVDNFGLMKVDKWADAKPNSIKEPGQTKLQDGVTMQDYIKKNRKAIQDDPPSFKDIKWLMYGGR